MADNSTPTSSSEAPLIPSPTPTANCGGDKSVAMATATTTTSTRTAASTSSEDYGEAATASTLKIRLDDKDRDKDVSSGDARSRRCPALSIALGIVLAGFAAALLVLGLMYSLDLRLGSATGPAGLPQRLELIGCADRMANSPAQFGANPDSGQLGGADLCGGGGGDFYALACSAYPASHPLRWRVGQMEPLRTRLADAQEAIEDALIERLYHGPGLPAEPATAAAPVWQLAVTNLTRACAEAAADFSRAGLLNLLAEQQPDAEADAESKRRLPPMSFFGRRSLDWQGGVSGAGARWEAALGRLAAHGLAFGADLSPLSAAAIAELDADVLGWQLEPRLPNINGDAAAVASLVKETFAGVLGRGVPQLIAEAVGRFHDNLTRTMSDAVGDSPQAMTLTEVGRLFPTGAEGWAAFQSAAFPDWAEGRYRRLLVRSPATLRRILQAAAELDPDSLAGYAFVNAVAGLERFAVSLGDFFDGKAERLVRLRRRRRLPLGPESPPESAGRRCLRVAFDLMPSPSALALLQPSPSSSNSGSGSGSGSQNVRHLLASLRSRLADSIRAADVDLESKRALLRALDGERYGYAFGDTDEAADLRMANAYGGLTVSREAGYLTAVLDILQHRRRSGFARAFFRNHGGADDRGDSVEDVLGAAPALLTELNSPGLRFPLAVNHLALPSSASLTLLTAHDLLSAATAALPASLTLRCAGGGGGNRSSSSAASKSSIQARRQLLSVSLALAAIRPSSSAAAAAAAATAEKAEAAKELERSFLLTSARLLACHRAAPEIRQPSGSADGLSMADRARLLTALPEFGRAFGCDETSTAGPRICRLLE